MATFIITSPDGKEYEVEGQGTEQEAVQALQSQLATGQQDTQSQAVGVKGDLWPISRMERNGQTVPGSREFDSDSGILGMIKRGFTAPHDVMTGELQLYNQDGTPNPDAVGRAYEMGSFATPMSPASRIPKIAGPQPQRQPSPGQMTQTAAQQNVDDAAQFGIDLDRGQATRNIPDQAFAQDALTGGRGGAAQKAFLKQRDLQQGQVDDAITGIADRLAPSRSNEISEIAGNVGNAIQGKSDRFKEAGKAFYRKTESSDAQVLPEAIKQLNGRVRGKLDDSMLMFGDDVGEGLPNTARFLKHIDGLPAKAKNEPVDWYNIELLRKNIGKSWAPGDDGRGLTIIKGEIDDWIQQTIESGLYSGDKKFLDNLLKARGYMTKHFSIAKSKNNTIKKMAAGELDAGQIANVLYGKSKLGSRGDSASIVRQIKKTIGENHPAFKDIRRGIMIRIFKNNEGETNATQRIATDIYDLVNGGGKQLFSELFGESSRLEMTKFASVLRKLKVDDLAGNPSRSGQTMLRRVSEQLDKLFPVIGLALGDFTGMVGGVAASQAMKVGAGTKARRLIGSPVPIPRQPINIPTIPNARGAFLPAMRSQGGTVPRR